MALQIKNANYGQSMKDLTISESLNNNTLIDDLS